MNASTGNRFENDTPIHIRGVDVSVTPDDRDYLRRKLRARLERFGTRVERASVRIEDVNGPRGGADHRCRTKVVLSGMPSVTVEEERPVLRAAVDGALGRIAAAVRRGVGRRAVSGRQKTARRSAARRKPQPSRGRDPT